MNIFTHGINDTTDTILAIMMLLAIVGLIYELLMKLYEGYHNDYK